jgi:hypothetical protein
LIVVRDSDKLVQQAQRYLLKKSGSFAEKFLAGKIPASLRSPAERAVRSFPNALLGSLTRGDILTRSCIFEWRCHMAWHALYALEGIFLFGGPLNVHRYIIDTRKIRVIDGDIPYSAFST